jgi:hypothetical protein
MMKVSSLYNFICVLLLDAILIYQIFDPCKVKVRQRRDCGYSGISPETCTGSAKISLMLRDMGVLIPTVLKWGLVAVPKYHLFMMSDLPKSAGYIYGIIGFVSAMTISRCCYEAVEGAPHCYH